MTTRHAASEKAPSGDGQAGDGWEHFTHDADIGVRGRGATLAEAFEKAAFAMTAAIADPSLVSPREVIEIECSAPRPDLLFYDWLNAIVFEMATRAMLFSRFAVAIDGDRLSAKIAGEEIDVTRHEPAVEVKGATLTELKVFQDDEDRWCAQCIIDV